MVCSADSKQKQTEGANKTKQPKQQQQKKQLKSGSSILIVGARLPTPTVSGVPVPLCYERNT